MNQKEPGSLPIRLPHKRVRPDRNSNSHNAFVQEEVSPKSPSNSSEAGQKEQEDDRSGSEEFSIKKGKNYE